MRRTTLMSAAALVVGALGPAQAQTVDPRITIVRPPVAGLASEPPHAVIGLTTGGATGPRDTLGILVTSVVSGSPADRAGIEEGNRIASINGVSLKLGSSDVGDDEMATAMAHRLERALNTLKPGDDLTLRVYASGQTKTVTVKTVPAATLYPAQSNADELLRDRLSAARALAPSANRATLGLSIAVNGSKRDTLGVFVLGVDDGGPAAAAGIQEGSRIASINGVDLRVAREDAGDAEIGLAKEHRLEREVANLKVGDTAQLRVVDNGQSRTVKVTTARASSLADGVRSLTIIGDGQGSGEDNAIELNGIRINDLVQRAMSRADVNGLFGRLGLGAGASGIIRW
ncbi:MAG TPA: PDZ domain-containing protein [Gemmatimonadaceae bacterium]|nr:PDZ domain-containing protein [Gemmatimonadaceae bacterium]